jgi:UDP-N-acetylmuramate--alanine ligase
MLVAGPDVLDLGRRRRVHIVGVGGAGMSAIATVLAAMGHRVTGSDLKASPPAERLRAQGLVVEIGHDPAHLGDAEVVTVSTAVPASNPEVAAARQRGIPVLSRADMLAAIAALRRPVVVAGTKGKTTTTSMLALILVEAGMHPSFIAGGDVNEVGGGAVWDRGDWLVVEGDESDGTFLTLGAEAVVVTNVEPDHLDHYGSFPAMVDAFEVFVAGASGPRLACADDAEAAALAARVGATTYGLDPAADWRIGDLAERRASISFTVTPPSGPPIAIDLPVPGLHNARNACGALAMAVSLGAPAEAGVRALGRFMGVARRYQFRGEAGGVTVVDDYAHLPTAVAIVLRTARHGGWRRVVAVFQPHRYSRTATLWPRFADAFVDADLVVITDVYPAGEAPVPGISGKLIADAVLDAHPAAAVAWLPSRRSVLDYLARRLRPGDLCLMLGAGDITSVADDLLEALGHG